MVADFTQNLENRHNLVYVFYTTRLPTTMNKPHGIWENKTKHLIRVMGHGFPSCYFSKDGIGSKKGLWKLGELNITHWHGMLQNPVRE